MEFVPDIERLTRIFANAVAPAFFLGAVAAFVSIMTSRLTAVHDRIKGKRGTTDQAGATVRAGGRPEQLTRRAALLNQGIIAALGAGVCSTLLLALIFATQFFGGQRIYGAGMLFFIATLLLGFALARFAQEAWLARSDWEE
jgi:hypothetical protein